MTLQDAITYFTSQTRIMPGLSVACGTADRALTAQGGLADEQTRTPITGESIFDLASLTKLFTGLLVMRLHADGRLDLSKPVGFYAPQFTHLGDVPVDAVLGFEVGLTTTARLDAAPSPGEAYRLLFDIRPGAVRGRAYSDMHAMVLRHVIEGAAQQTWQELLSQCILRPVGMVNTTLVVEESKRGLCVSCDMEHRIEGGRYILRRTMPGTPHDPKAALLYPDASGHAGLFSTRTDMIRLCQALLRGEVIPRSSLLAMSRNRTGHLKPDGTYQQYLGAQCYVKHPVQRHSEVPPYMGETAIALSGFTGHHLSVDAERGIFALFLGSRCQNRLTVLTPEPGRTLTDYGLNPDGTGQVLWPDGRLVDSSVQYVYHKDEHFHKAAQASLELDP